MAKKIKTFNPMKATTIKPVGDKQRKADINFYASKQWRNFRETMIIRQPTCQRCTRVTVGEHCHHIIERKKCPSKTYDPTNIEVLCKSCHSKEHSDRRRKENR